VGVEDKLKLPEPNLKGKLSFEEAVKRRRSVRDFSPEAVSLQDLSQILWAAQGITGEGDFGRSCPSAGALYPLEIFVAVRKVERLKAGVYQYDVFQHELELIARGDRSEQLAEACLSQLFVAEAPISFIIGVDYSRITWRYGERGIRYVHFEVGHCGQNICLQATALGLGAVPIGAFWDKQVKEVVSIPENLDPLYVISVGYPRKEKSGRFS